MTKKHKVHLSKVSVLHYVKLVYRSLLLIAALISYIIVRIAGDQVNFKTIDKSPVILAIIWIVFVVEMILRFFPSDLESRGCQKQFKKNYIPKKNQKPVLHSWKITFLVAACWLALNAAIGVLYYTKIIDAGILLLISLAYSVCDMICILFFCPFQTWFMKNKCCGSCRIYNWDFAMMFTPLVFVKSYYTWSLLGIALLLLLVWEILVHKHPERFSETTNDYISCANCKEKLCHHKVQLRQFLKKNKDRLILKGNAIIEKKSRKKDKD